MRLQMLKSLKMADSFIGYMIKKPIDHRPHMLTYFIF
jgi:hypothetical protein